MKVWKKERDIERMLPYSEAKRGKKNKKKRLPDYEGVAEGETERKRERKDQRRTLPHSKEGRNGKIRVTEY